MKTEIVLGENSIYAMEVEERDGAYVVRIQSPDCDKSEEVIVDYHGSAGVANLQIDRKSYLLELSENSGTYQAGIGAHTLEAQLFTAEDRLREQMDTAYGSRHDSIDATMPGKVLEVFVQSGDHVEEGDRIAIIEAMKMENTIRAPHEGIIESVGVATGDSVQSGQNIITFEEHE